MTIEKSGVFCEFQKGHTGRCGFVAEYAHYDNGWYYCWLVERRDRSQPEWLTTDCAWTTDANKAMWFSRRGDADQFAGEIDADVIICEHGFMLDAALAHRADVARVLEPIESAPRTGRHILVYDLTPNSDGFGIFDGVRQPFAAVAHYWSHPGEEGFYLSSGSVDEPLMRITHWKEI